MARYGRFLVVVVSAHLARPGDYFPYAPSVTRGADPDHVIAFDTQGPPGQASESNLGVLVRHHHRIKTHGGWRVRPLARNLVEWTSPHGQVRITGPHGTRKPERDDYLLVDYTRVA